MWVSKLLPGARDIPDHPVATHHSAHFNGVGEAPVSRHEGHLPAVQRQDGLLGDEVIETYGALFLGHHQLEASKRKLPQHPQYLFQRTAECVYYWPTQRLFSSESNTFPKILFLSPGNDSYQGQDCVYSPLRTS